ncbi:hypothetical protein ACFP3I_01775 [Chryseobacterium arachidis]|uniref:hypothetical protein n=1 Tax=Chryseobacterium arachidis TaxID=1416778 RepID=UPI003610CF51
MANQSYGRGLGFPRTNLTTFQFNTSPMDNDVTLSHFDGMVVFNSATGNTVAGQGVQVAVIPGFYYFSNPGNPGNITNGRWIPMGTNSRVNVLNGVAAGVPTNTQVDGAQVYAYKGQFTTTGTSTAVTLAVPTGLTSMYGITIFKRASSGNKVVFSKELYSFDSTNGAAVTGSPSMSVVYPADTYDYILEYFK